MLYWFTNDELEAMRKRRVEDAPCPFCEAERKREEAAAQQTDKVGN